MTSMIDIPSRPVSVSPARLVPLNSKGPWPIDHLVLGKGDINAQQAQAPEERLFGTRIREAIRTLTS